MKGLKMSKEKWTPEEGDRYFWVGSDAMAIEREFNINDSCDYTRFQCGNYFRTIEEAQEAAEKFKELLLNLHEVKEEEKPNLPKLTAEVFDRTGYTKTIRYAVVTKDGSVIGYTSKPYINEKYNCWAFDTGCCFTLETAGTYDSTDWQNSLIERPEKKPKRPDWMKYEKWFYFRGNYVKLFAVREKYNIISLDFLSGNRKVYSPKEVYTEAVEARLRPWTFEEAPVVLKVKDPHGFALAYLSPFGGKYVIAYHHPDEYEKLKLGEVTFTFSAFADIFTQIDGSPCGVLEHLNENGEWVK